MLTPSNGECGPREDRPTDKTRANGFTSQSVFHAMAPAIGVDAAMRLTDRLVRLQALLEEEAIRLTASLQVQSSGRIDNHLQERAR